MLFSYSSRNSLKQFIAVIARVAWTISVNMAVLYEFG